MDLMSSGSIMKKSYYNSNEKIYTRNGLCYKISNTVTNFDANAFAKWMQSGYSKDKYSNYETFAKIVKSNPATISRLMTGKSQTLTDKPSQPKRDLVIRLAKEFDKDVDEALFLAGYAPSKEILPAQLAVTGFEGLDDDDLQDIAEYVRFKREQRAAKNNQR